MSDEGSFMWAVEQMKLGKKVRRPYFEKSHSWERNRSTNLVVVNQTGQRLDNITWFEINATDWEVVSEDKDWTLAEQRLDNLFFGHITKEPTYYHCFKNEDIKKCRDLQIQDLGITGNSKNGWITPITISSDKIIRALERFGDLKMKNIILENGKVVSISDESYKALSKAVSNSNPFKGLVGLYNNCLCVFSKKMLKSLTVGGISYNNMYRESYNESPAFEEIDHTELKEGDVFYCGSLQEALGDKPTKENIFIFIGFDTDDKYASGIFLSDSYGNEVIDNSSFRGRVVRFLRKPLED